MKLVPKIRAAYVQTDEHLVSQFNIALNANKPNMQKRILEYRRLNDNAYFVLLWGQLENEINAKFVAMIQSGQAQTNWRERRKFDHYNIDKTKFEDRLSLLLDKKAGRGSPWALAIRNYGLRNQIAHGESDMTGADVLTVIEELYKVQAALTV